MDVRGDTSILKNIGKMEYRGGLSMLFVISVRNAGRKGKHFRFPFQYVMFCDNLISFYILLDSVKVVYKISIT